MELSVLVKKHSYYSNFDRILLIYRNMENLDCAKAKSAEPFNNIRDMVRRQQPDLSREVISNALRNLDDLTVRQSLYKEIEKFQPAIEKIRSRLFQQNPSTRHFGTARSRNVKKEKWYPKREPLDNNIPEFDETIVKKYLVEGLHTLSDAEIIVKNYLRDETSELSKQMLMDDTYHKNIITAIRHVAEYGSSFLFMEFNSSFGSLGNVEETYNDIKNSIKQGELFLVIACTIKAKDTSSTENTANLVIEENCLPEDM